MHHSYITKRASTAQALVIVALFSFSEASAGQNEPLNKSVATLLISEFSDSRHAHHAQKVHQAIDSELRKRNISVVNPSYSKSIMTPKDPARTRKCAKTPQCLRKLNADLQSSLLISGFLDTDPQGGLLLHWNLVSSADSNLFNSHRISLPPRISPQKLAQNLIQDLILPNLPTEEPELISLIPIARPSNSSPVEPSLVVPPRQAPLDRSAHSALYWSGVLSTAVGATVLCAATVFRLKSFAAESTITPDAAQIPAGEALQTAQEDFDLSLNLVVAGTVISLLGGGIFGLDLLLDSGRPGSTQLVLSPNHIKVISAF